jgi:hypothetical protein
VATGAGPRAKAKAVDSPPDPTVCAPELYPDRLGLAVFAPRSRDSGVARFHLVASGGAMSDLVAWFMPAKPVHV